MKSMKKNRFLIKAIVFLLSVFLLNQAIAQYEITKHTINNGGGTSTNVNQDVSITGSIGQPDAAAPLTGGGYKLSGGFWTEGTKPDLLFNDGFE